MPFSLYYRYLYFAKLRTLISKKLPLFATISFFIHTLPEKFGKNHGSDFPIFSIDAIFHFRCFYLTLYQPCIFQLFQMLRNCRFRDRQHFVDVAEKTVHECGVRGVAEGFAGALQILKKNCSRDFFAEDERNSKMIRVTHFNIASSFGEDKKSDWTRAARIIRESAPDAVSCNEVSVHEDFVPDLDMPALYGDYLGMTPVFGRATSRDGKGEYGVMALAEYKIEFVDKLLLPTPAGYEQRICLMTKVYAPTPFHFLVTHFCTRNEYPGAREHRVAAIQMITDKINERKLYPAVLCGDLNVEPGTPEIDFLHTQWDVCNDQAEPGVWTHHSGAMIDFICTYPKGAVRLLNFSVGTHTAASDHCPVTAELEF